MNAHELADALNGAQKITPIGPKIDNEGTVLNPDDVHTVPSGLSLTEDDVASLVDTLAENPALYTELAGMVNRTITAARSISGLGYWGKYPLQGNQEAPSAEDIAH